MRLHTVGGQLTAKQLKKVYEIAEKYGKGYIHLTARQGVEIPFIHLQDIDAVRAELREGGIEQGACGPRVRTVTACQGSAICPSGLIETQKLAEKLDAHYFRRDLPHKFKISITGCHNNCLKTEENDLGIKGAMQPFWGKDACTYCGVCQAVCPEKCITVDKEKKTVHISDDQCSKCGRCVKSCPTGAWSGKNGYQVSFGGTFGNNFRFGKPLIPMVFTEEKIIEVADAVIDYYQENGRPSERFAKMLERIGTDGLQAKLQEVIK